MEPSERCAIWRSCELIVRPLPGVRVRVRVRRRRGSACAGGSVRVRFWGCCCSAINIGHREIPPAHLGQSVRRQQSVISHLPQTGAPANEVSAKPFLPTVPTVFVAGQNRWARVAPSPCQHGRGEPVLSVGTQEAGYRSGRPERVAPGVRAITQNPKGIWAQDWGRPDSRSSQAIAFAPGLSPQVQIQTLSSDLKCGGKGRMRGSGHLPEPHSVYFIWKHGAAFLGSRFSNGSVRKPDLWEGKATRGRESARSHLGSFTLKLNCVRKHSDRSHPSYTSSRPWFGGSWRGRQESPAELVSGDAGSGPHSAPN